MSGAAFRRRKSAVKVTRTRRRVPASCMGRRCPPRGNTAGGACRAAPVPFCPLPWEGGFPALPPHAAAASALGAPTAIARRRQVVCGRAHFSG